MWADGSVIYNEPPDYEGISPTLEFPTTRTTLAVAAADIERTTATDRPTGGEPKIRSQNDVGTISREYYYAYTAAIIIIPYRLYVIQLLLFPGILI